RRPTSASTTRPPTSCTTSRSSCAAASDRSRTRKRCSMAAAVESASLRVEPSLDEVRALARDHNVIALRNRFLDDCQTPVSAFLKLRGLNPQYPAFLLESAEQGQRVGRYSFLGLRPRKVIR